MIYWIIAASTIGNMTCNPNGIGCDLILRDVHYPSLEMCRKEAPWAVGKAVSFGGDGVQKVVWRCEKIDENPQPTPLHGIVLEHNDADDDR